MCFSCSDDRFDTPHYYTQTIFMEIPHFRMGIEVMTIWEKLLTNAHNSSLRGGHHQSSKPSRGDHESRQKLIEAVDISFISDKIS